VDQWAVRPWITGLLAGLAWVPTCALPLAFVHVCFVWTPWDFGMGLLLSAGLAVTVGAVAGPLVGSSLIEAAAIVIARKNEVRPVAAVMRSGVIRLLMILVAFVAIENTIDTFNSSTESSADSSLWGSPVGPDIPPDPGGMSMLAGVGVNVMAIAIALGLLACCQALVGILTRATLRRMQGGDQANLWRAMLVPAFAAATFLVVLPLCALWGANWLWLRSSLSVDRWSAALFALQLVMSLVALVAAVTLARAERAVSGPRIAYRAPKALDITVVVLVWAAGLSFPVLHTDMWPWLTRAERLPEGAHSIEWAFTSWPQTKKWKWSLAAGPALIHYKLSAVPRPGISFGRIPTEDASITVKNGLRIAFWDDQELKSHGLLVEHNSSEEEESEEMYAPDGSLSVTASDVDMSHAEATLPFRLDADRIQTLDCESSGKVSSTDRLIYLCRLTLGADGLLRGSLTLNFDENTPASEHVLEFASRYGSRYGFNPETDDLYIGSISSGGIAIVEDVTFGLDNSRFLPVSGGWAKPLINIYASTRHAKIDLTLQPNAKRFNQSASTALPSAPNAPEGAGFVVAIRVTPQAPDAKPQAPDAKPQAPEKKADCNDNERR
jgi:hypothetical protein